MGTITLDGFSLDGNGIAAGLVQVDVTMEALVNGNGVAMGSDSESMLVRPGQTSYPVSRHTIYAGSSQGFDTSATASSTFTVTK